MRGMLRTVTSGATGLWLPSVIAGALPAVFLLPFVNKAFSVDDILFVLGGRHILSHPLDFWGYKLLWGCNYVASHEINFNPPGAAYWAAAAIGLFGEREWTLHLWFLLPSVAASLGLYRVARRWTARPGIAAALMVVSPVFLLCGSTVMCDTLMVACYVWAIVLWVDGLDRRSWTRLAAAGVLMAAAALSKYFGATAIPLLLAYTITRRTTWWRAYATFLIPAAILGGYEWGTAHLYGHGLIAFASEYSANFKAPAEWLQNSRLSDKLVIGLGFAGGCFLPALLTAPLLWRARIWAPALGAGAGLVAWLLHVNTTCRAFVFAQDGMHVLTATQWVLYVTGGLLIALLLVNDLVRRRDSVSILLALWIGGTFVFVTAVYWTVNGRTLLPIAPAAALLIARRLDYLPRPPRRGFMGAVLALSAALSVVVLQGEAAWTGAARSAVAALDSELRAAAITPSYQGQWGLPYYAERAGWPPFDMDRVFGYAPNERIVTARNNIGCPELPRMVADTLTREFPVPAVVSTMHRDVGAGFHTHFWGPLPYVFGPVPREIYDVLMLMQVQVIPITLPSTPVPAAPPQEK